jgi:RNA methyltransferase, TrmH family
MDHAGSPEPHRAGQVPGVEREAARLAADPDVVLDGFHSVKHAIRFGADVLLLLTTDAGRVLGLAESLAPDIVGRLRAEMATVDVALIRRIRGVDPGSEVVGFARRPTTSADLVRPSTPLVLLDNPRNPGNLGAVVRVAAGFGATAVLSTGSVDPWHPAVVRGSGGLHFATSVQRVTLDDPVLAGHIPLIAFDPAGEDLRGVELPDASVLAFGSERRGLSAAVRSRADALVAIPMRDLVSSYNLATSVAVALYHWCQRRRPVPR